MVRSLQLSLVLSVVIGSLLGCGGPDRPPTVKVSGTLTFAGGPPPASGTLFFVPLSSATGLPQRPGQANFDTSGTFQVTSFQEHDGLIPGTYAVKVECWKEYTGYEGDVPVSHVPKTFQPPELVVPVDQESITYDLDVR